MANTTHRIYSQFLGAGTNLDDIRTAGYYDVENPAGLPLGTYSVLVLGGSNNIPGAVKTKQIAYNLSTTSIYNRSKTGDSSWGTFTDVLTGGGASATQVFNVLDYGGLADNNPASGATNRAAFEAAIVDATAAGGGAIYAPRGTYFINYGGSASVGGIRLRDNMVLMGDGMGVTVIKAADIGNNDMAGLVRTQSGIENENVMVRDLTIDGNKQGQTGWANIICFFAGVTPANRVLMDRDIWCVNVECRNGKNGTAGSSNLSRGYGFDPHEVVDRFVAINCIAHDCERDGFVLDGVLNFQLTSCKSWSNGRHGFNFITESYNGDVVNCHAWDNATLGTGNNFTAQSDSHHIKLLGCRSRGGAENGIRLRRGETIRETHFQVIDCVIEGAGKNGIQATGGKYNTISGNSLLNNGQSADNTYFDVALDEDNGDTGPFTGEEACVVKNNRAIALLANKTKAAYREDDAASAPPLGNTFAWNDAQGQHQGKYLDITGVGSIIRDRGYTDDYYAFDHGVLATNADNGPLLRSLVDYVELQGGGEIVLPPGILHVGGTGIASQGCISLPSNVSIRGQGLSVTTVRAIDPVNADITGVIRTLAGAANVGNSVRDLSIASAAATGTGSVTLLYFGGTTDTNPIVENVEVSGAQNGTSNAGYGARFTSSVDGARVTNLRCLSNERDGLYLNGAQNTVVNDLYTSANGRHNVLISGAVGCTLSNQINIGAVTNGVTITGDCDGLLLSGGRVQGAGQEGIRFLRDTGSTTPEVYSAVRDMLIDQSGRNGLRISSVHHVTVSGNTFRNNGASINNTYADIALDNDSTFAATKAQFNSILSNTFIVPAAGNKVGWNIREVDGQASDNVFRDYISRGTPGTDIIVTATGSNSITHTYPATSGTLALLSDIGSATGPQFGAAAFAMANPRNLGGTTLDLHGVSLAAGTVGTNIVTTATSRTFSAASVQGASRRIGYVSGSAGGNGALLGSNSSNYVSRGNVANAGGFRATYTFILTATAATARAFFGLAALSGTAANANSAADTTIASNVNIIGVGFDSGDANFSIYHNDASGTATKIDLSGSFTAVTDRMITVTLTCPRGGGDISYTVSDPVNGTGAFGTISADLPAGTVALAPQFAINNGGTASAVSFDFCALALESSN